MDGTLKILLLSALIAIVVNPVIYSEDLRIQEWIFNSVSKGISCGSGTMSNNYCSDQAGSNVLNDILQRLDGIGRLEASLAKATSDFNTELTS